MAGEPLHFVASRTGHRALGAVPVDSVNTVEAEVVVTRASGRSDTLHASVTPPPLPPPKERLQVASQFGRQLDSATAARVAREGALALAVGRRAHDAPPRWTAAFLRPRASDVTSGFGTGRTFNGEVTSRHLGVDYRGATGSPIRAANRGVVVLVDTFFLGGRVVYLDHGGGADDGVSPPEQGARRRRRHRGARAADRARGRDRARHGPAPALDGALRRDHGESAGAAEARRAHSSR